jgi:hypothetical protein
MHQSGFEELRELFFASHAERYTVFRQLLKQGSGARLYNS